MRFGAVWLAVVLLGGLLVACAAPNAAYEPLPVAGPAGAAAPVDANPLGRVPAGSFVGGRRLRTLLAIAESEWRRWGGQRVCTDAEGRACAILADGRCEVVDDGCGREQMPGLCAVVDHYWDSIRRTTGIHRFAHDCSRTGICEARWPGPDAPLDTPAWSAAFISALFTRAGFGPDEFLPSPYHADYVTAARDGRTSAYQVLPTPAWAMPGDLLCATRPTRRLPEPPRTVADIRASGIGGGPTPMHCDLVVSVDHSRRIAYAVGGNVMQAVSLIDVPLDSQGRIGDASQAERGWTLVMRLRDAWRAAD